MIIGCRSLTVAEQAALAHYPIATTAPEPAQLTDEELRAFWERRARDGRRRRAAERGQDWTKVQ